VAGNVLEKSAKRKRGKYLLPLSKASSSRMAEKKRPGDEGKVAHEKGGQDLNELSV